MPWLIGIDEAGYGPNLGPFVAAAVAVRVPDAAADAWGLLAAGVRRAGGREDGRVVIDDSKRVYAPARGPAGLEAGVRAALFAGTGPDTLAGLAAAVCPGSLADLAGEPWWTGLTPLPFAAGDVGVRAERFAAACAAAGVGRPVAAAVAVPAPRFNAVCRRCGSKGGVLSEALVTLLTWAAGVTGGEPFRLAADKQGGRSFYLPMLREAFPGAGVEVECEGMESVYRLGGDSVLAFRPRADADSLPVALASMTAKYLRELFMHEFNTFWRTHVPGLRPTAGYPVDAKRFFADIGPALGRMGLAADAVWRER